MKRILVVEDEGIVRKDISDRLTAFAYEVCAASSGEEALEKCVSFAPDLVLMDIMLHKEMDGVTTAAKIADRFCIPVVYLTAYADERTLDRAAATNPYGYVLKPFEEHELRMNIEIALHKHALENRLRENRQWFSATLTSIGDGVIATDGDGMIMFMNPVSEKLTGWREDEARGKPLAAVFQVRTPGVAIPAVPVKQSAVFQDIVLEDKGGHPIAVEASISPIKNGNGSVAGSVIVFRDITEQKKVRDQLIQSSKMAAVGTLAGGIAHEFNNLISIMRSKSELALMDGDHASATDACRSVMVATERAQKIVQSLLSFSRRLKPSLEAVQLSGILEETLFLVERELAKQHIKIVKEYAGMSPIMVDIGQIQQVFLNIVVNAREAMPSGGTLTLRVFEKDGDQCVEIEDTGQGVKTEYLTRIFEPFFTTKDASRPRATGGNGLGLSVSLGIIENHGGEIRVRTSERGTCFTVSLPGSKTQQGESHAERTDTDC